MSDIDNGGPAFPHLRRNVAENTYEPIAEGGMTLRDYFAAKAMQAIISRIDLSDLIAALHPDSENETEMDITHCSYAIASRMLLEKSLCGRLEV